MSEAASPWLGVDRLIVGTRMTTPKHVDGRQINQEPRIAGATLPLDFATGKNVALLIDKKNGWAVFRWDRCERMQLIGCGNEHAFFEDTEPERCPRKRPCRSAENLFPLGLTVAS